ncbi:major Facilitator Superfamily protein [Methyloversatilis sp. RAC08]|uniref:BCD family MFS transporter n=1 Tax=Methyloversatilis sp. RAC08 TaxID=1842540 RepID=UPI00083D0024|nr:BCD family MFS transporter [Methyloversatilis sp. RAC08]AOF80931.1 major Facilitator Superfamily protein [Methyloversatilis sp. RAC08]
MAQLGWLGIFRLGLVQTALGAIVVLTTSTLNRVMVVELALPAMLPGVLVALHYMVQMLRPRMGHGSDVGGRRTPWIIGGMAVLAVGGTLAAVATAWMATEQVAGVVLAVFAFLLIGAGVGSAGTSLLVLLAKRVDPTRRAAAATVVWMMMILGFALTAGITGKLLDPFTTLRLVQVVAATSLIAFVVALLAVRGVEGRPEASRDAASPDPTAASSRNPELSSTPGSSTQRTPFRAALAQVWGESQARLFTIFVFVSMLAYSAQDLILEPFAGTVFGYTPGESTQLAGLQHGGVFAGMLLVALMGSVFGGRQIGSLKVWTVGGCIASALALFGLAAGGFMNGAWPLRETVFALGVANGAFAVAAIASMMSLAGAGGAGREGVRMGLWGAAQAIAFGLGGFAGTVAIDVTRAFIESPGFAYALVFACEGVLFVVSAVMALRIVAAPARRAARDPLVAEPPFMSGIEGKA